MSATPSSGSASRRLRGVLIVNAALSGVCGAVLLVFHSALAGALLTEGLFGLSQALFLIVNGAGLLGFAALVARVAAPAEPKRAVVKAIIAMDAAWAVSTLGLLAATPASFTVLGASLVIATAALVALIAALQARWVRWSVPV